MNQPLAYVHPGAKIAKNVVIEPFTTINNNVIIGEGTWIGSNVTIMEGARIGKNCNIFPGSVISAVPQDLKYNNEETTVEIGDNVTIGSDTTLFAGVKVYSESIIGKNCTLHAGVIIGCDGFGFVSDENGFYKKVPQTGNVIIEDNVDIGSTTTIDRATLGSTIIRKGAKLDNQIQIAHNVEIGINTVIAAQTGIAGSTKVGDNCQIGGQVGIVGHIIIGNNVRIQAQSGISRSIKDNETVQGSPALPYSDYNKSYVHFKNLSKLVDRINELEKRSNIQKEDLR